MKSDYSVTSPQSEHSSGISEEILRHQLGTPGIKGIVLKTFGAGNAPTAQWFTDAIREAVDRGIVIVTLSARP